MFERQFQPRDVRQVLATDKVIAAYPQDRPFPSVYY
ncbi:MAG: DUF4258 domain-containing protein [Desulfobacca sp.]